MMIVPLLITGYRAWIQASPMVRVEQWVRALRRFLMARHIYAGAVVIIGLALGLIRPLSAADLHFTATVDRTTLSVTETLTLTIQIEGAVASLPDPELPDLSDFRILSGPNESSTFQFINGKYSYTKTLTYILKPERVGQLTIGSATLKKGRKTYHTQPITLQVSGRGTYQQPGQPAPVPAPQVQGKAPEIFVQVSADKKKLFQNEQVILTYTLYTRITVNSYEISRLPSTPGFWTEEFEIPRQPVVRDAVVAGRHYRTAVIRRVALFPTRTGDLVVDPLEVTCEVQVEDRTHRRSRDPFDMLFDSPFLRFRTEERFIETEPLTLHVAPLPTAGKPEDFSGAVGEFSLKVWLDRQQAKANEALTMKVKYSGQGNIKMLPRPHFKAPPDFESYAPKESVWVNKTGDKISGTKTYEYVLIPRLAGKKQIPPISFCFFDPVRKAYKTLTAGGFEIEVEPGAVTPLAGVTGLSKEEVELLNQDIHYLKSPGRLLPISSINRLPSSYWLAMALPLLIAILLGGGIRILSGASLELRRQARRKYFRALKELRALDKIASSGADEKAARVYGGIYRILISYLGNRLNLPAAGLKEEEVLNQLSRRQVAEPLLSEIKEILHLCNWARFAPGSEESTQLDQALRRSRLVLEKLESSWGRSG